MFVVVVSEVWRTAFFNSLLIVQGDYNIHYVLVLSLFNHALYISNTYSQVFGWTDSTIMQFALWGCLDFPIFFLPAAILLTYSLRGSVVFVILIPQNSTYWNISHFFVLKSWCLFVWSCLTIIHPQVAGSGCMALGAGLRSLPFFFPNLQPHFTLLCHLGSSLHFLSKDYQPVAWWNN